MTERDVDAGEMFEEGSELEAFAAELRRAAADAPLPRIGAALAAVLDGSKAPAPSDLAVPVAGGRRRRLATRARLRLVLAGGVAAAVLVIAAAGGSLPQPAQRNVARFADRVGVDLPDGEGAGVRSTEDRPAPPSTAPPTAPPVASPTTPPPTHAAAVAPEPVADADAVEGLRDGDDEPTTPGRAEVAPGSDIRPTDDRGRDDEQRDEHEPDPDPRAEDTTKRARPDPRPDQQHESSP